MAPRPAGSLWEKVHTLSRKNSIILYQRHTISTLYTAIFLPVLLAIYLGIMRNVNNPLDDYGIAESRPIMSLGDALGAADGSRNTVLFINNDLTGGDIDAVIDDLIQDVESAGKSAERRSSPDAVNEICKSSFQGASNCFGAVIFNSSPDQGDGNGWNYTLRGDLALGREVKINKEDNDAQVYMLPLQRAVDNAIVRTGNSDSREIGRTEEWAFTDETEEEREEGVRRRYQSSFTQYLSVGLIVIFYGLVYRLPGSMATEREKGLSQLIDAMMPTNYESEAQLARMLSFLYSYTFTYFPGWVVAAVIIRMMIWKQTNIGIVMVFFILAGMSVTSMGIMGGTFFKKTQLSGPANAIVFLLLAVLAQAIPDPPTAAVAVLSVFFAPCNIIFMFIQIAKYERDGLSTDLLKGPPDSNSTLPGLAHFIFAGVQFVVYPVIAAFLERAIHGVADESRKIYKGGPNEKPMQDAVVIEGLTKVYRPSLFRRIFSFIVKPRAPTVAVDNLNLVAKRGQIVSLLGANGSGKSTTLDAVAGIHRFNQGSVSIDASGGVGIAPQKNVLWDELTVLEHLRLFNDLKSPGATASAYELHQLMEAIGLSQKKKAQVHTLSGGQKRKLQLGMMLTGGSAVCCVDEVSSGIDPLSRRKIWDILLSERGRRTIILTTHFLDEADLLSDDIAILSKGTLRAQGSPVVLKDRLGAGYRIHILNAKNVRSPPSLPGVKCEVTSTNITYTAPSSEMAATVIRALEGAGLEYRMSNPTIEDVFLAVTEEVQNEQGLLSGVTSSQGISPMESESSDDHLTRKKAPGRGLELLSGKQTGAVKQTIVLVKKRFTLFKSNWIPYVVALLIPVVAAAAAQTFLRGEEQVGCSPREQSSAEDGEKWQDIFDNVLIAAGPRGDFPSGSSSGSVLNMTGASTDSINIELRNSFSDLRRYVEDNRKDVNPGGFWLGSSDQAPTIAYRADGGTSVYTAVIMQNLLNTLKSNVSIATQYRAFDSSVPGITTDLIIAAAIFTIACGIAPAFFGFYPNVERRTNVRSLQYSSGVRSLALWCSHLAFDFSIFLVAFVAAAVAFIASSDVWYHGGILFPVFLLYGLVAILLAYVWSLFMASQLATFAAILVHNTVGFAIYFIAFLFIISFSPVQQTERNILIAHYTIAAFFPNGSLFRALMVGLNLFATTCDGDQLYSFPADINAYGAPILYLATQAVLLFGFILWNDSGNKLPSFMRSKKRLQQSYRPDIDDSEIAGETNRVYAENNRDGLQVKNLVKVFDKHTAVDNVTFGVQHGEVFALLGPNGAGKSTTISLIRGDIAPSAGGGDVFVQQVSVTDQRALARSNLGVCPQFDALDNMTVLEHLRHYAHLRGISNVERQVQAVVRAVGLEAFQHTLAPHLSGGNKRKLSLGIALTGNPSVILLDEPSSGLDAAAKRIMWRTLETVVPGRSILLTTHSMEEADALASRAGIIAQRMLAVGEVDTLRQRFGDSLYVHLVSRTAPYSTPEEMERMRAWIQHLLPAAQIEAETYHGQMRFSVPARAILERSRQTPRRDDAAQASASAIGHLIVLLEEHKNVLGIEHHSVSPTTLEDVFLAIVGRHNVQEEGYAKEADAAEQRRRAQAGFWGRIDWAKVRKVTLGF
ncbi:ABC transporter A family member-like protein [Emericellopsis cladophorae]|uniref:ABC transporter A family member-like protein n=1 Tax=Emericellopsis cladophorae TaxID=2686198 RepID=A0A9P9Y7P3_9HYPO|nr:ABC transporter A family member-like protein [Emericellopsis cladophorae]KAI6784863.1 ABC transporter A family member-like protein [Emericellopsis cladophorae]